MTNRPRRLLAAFNVQKLLLAGVTGFLDADCLWNLGPALRDSIEAGIVEGPRMTAGMNALLTAAGGTAGRLIPDSGTAAYAHVMGDRDEMVRTTRQQIKYGADWVKIHVTGSLPNHTGELTVWTIDELRAVTDTAHDLDTPTIAHCRNADATRLAAEAGVDLILHASFIDERALEAVVEAGCAIAPDVHVPRQPGRPRRARSAAPAHRSTCSGARSRPPRRCCGRRTMPASRSSSGSESGFALTPYGHWHAREMEVLVEAMGLTPLEAIRCATYNGARALRMDEGTVGVVADGAAADLLVVRGDPSLDVARARRPVEPVSRHLSRSSGRSRPTVARAKPAPRREGRPVGHRAADVGEGQPMTRSVVVSGAGQGLGAAIAQAAADVGWRVGVLDRDRRRRGAHRGRHR